MYHIIFIHTLVISLCAAIKDMASNIERRWRQMVAPPENGTKGPDGSKTEVKKRKPEAPPQKGLPPTKKPAVGTAQSSKPVTVKKEAKPVVTAVKDAKSDSSFFSAPKPKPKLPSFKKAPPAPVVKKEPGLNVAQPSSIDPFQEALKFMAKSRKDSPAVATPPPASETPPQASGPNKAIKKRKSVTWAPDSQLESVLLIEKAVYDDDPVDGSHGLHTLRELDRGEGAALHAHLFEEAIDWYESPPIEFPIDIEVRPRGEESKEREAQELREQTALSAAYMSAAHIPASPAEPTIIIPEEDVDKEVATMTSGPDVDAVFWSTPAVSGPSGSPAPPSSVADLVSQLSDVSGLSQPNVPDLSGFDPQVAMQAMQSMSQDKLQHLLQQLAGFQQPQPGAPPAQQQSYAGAPDQQWSSSSGSYGGYYNDAEMREPWQGDRGGGRGRGRGRGRGGFGRGDDGYRFNKRRPCSFFAAGRCKFGDQCDFAHDIPGPGASY
ncbi:hypothetical protein HGRIS_009166 [Hohenbuehelia grisea]|uniref:C3H1-type domain-containing protein n=1 Tax=Hohenbuehelia grisea TaxID=104357 RepID=A0ABR3J0B0_9AGAR